jgi:acetyltransferase-like isoleucine patch superfamily enzyme
MQFGYLDPTAQVLDPHLSIFLRPDQIYVGAHSRLDGLIKIEGGDGVRFGDHVHIASFGHIGAGGGEVIIGDHSGTASHVVICSGMPDLSYLHICAADMPDQRHPRRQKTVIGRHVVIFAGAIICPGVSIADGAVIAAGAVVTRDVAALEIWAGVPAKRTGKRRLEELQEFILEQEMLF